MATVKACGEWWRQKRLFEMLDWCRSHSQATVIRQGVSARVRFTDVLVGDVVVVAAGDIVPADGILIESSGLRVKADQGDSADPDSEHDAADGDEVHIKNAVDSPFLAAGSMVVEGEAIFLVTAVGICSNWEAVAAAGLGSKVVARLVRDPVPLRRPLERLARSVALLQRLVVPCTRCHAPRAIQASCRTSGLILCCCGAVL